ncbi:MAG TPA: CoA transferase [Candidatus Binataceae bacterium]|nr:CoA transferase [Candidatus Binataceae bacterium]
MATKPLIPQSFGPLQGVRIISSGLFIAQPFAAELAAEMGAEVIHIEQPQIGDVGWRSFGNRLPARDGGEPVGTSWIQERRNMLSVTLDLSKPRGRELFLRLVATAELWMESSRPGTYQKWGLDDAAVWAVNPRLVITHVSGYGQDGHPDYVSRPALDAISQGFGGTMYLTGFPDPMPPTRAAPWIGDYLTSYSALASSMAALLHARSTGKGQSVDVALFEMIHKTLGGTMIDYFHDGIVHERYGNRSRLFQPIDTFRARDGWVMLAAVAGLYERLCRAIGLDPADPRWRIAATNLDSPEGLEFDRILRQWIGGRTVAEVVRTLGNEAKVPCGPILSSKEIAADPHYQARGVHVEWDDEQVGRVKGIGVAPKFSDTPGRIWRGSVRLGHDNATVYRELLGLSDAELDELRQQQVI